MTERWVAKSVATAIICERSGASDFKSRALLDQAVADGVRLYVGGVPRSRASITDDQWVRGGMGGEGLRHVDGVGRPIMISEDELLDWLREKAPQPPAHVVPDAPEQPGPQQPTLRETIEKRLRAGERPGENIQWKPFCNAIRKDVGGPRRGNSYTVIKRITRPLLKLLQEAK